MLRRLLPGSLVALVLVVMGGALTSACTVGPQALTVGGTSVSTSSINGQLSTLAQSTAGGCLLQVEQAGQTSSDAVGTGYTGTYSMKTATQVVSNEVGLLLTQQLAASKGFTITSAQLATARADYQDILDGEIATASQSSSSNGSAASCTQSDGQAYSAAQLIRDLPTSMVADRVRNQAYDEALLADGADRSSKAVAAYYLANTSLFTDDCVSRIASSSQTASQQLVNQLNAGASFSALAMANSIDTTTASQGGSLGCNFTESQVLQSLNVQSAAVGAPIGPLQDSSTGQWLIYEVTSRVVEPLAQATPLIKRELLFVTSNQQRVDNELRTFARRTSVYVNPQYGSWKGLTVVAPTSPPAQFLLAPSLGNSVESGSGGTRLQLNGGS